VRAAAGALVALVLGVPPTWAQEEAPCRVLCAPEFKVEPTITFSHLFGSPRIASDDGTVTRELRETDFEVILSLGLPTRVPWLEFTVEAIFLPFDRDSTPELEFEGNFVWLPGSAREAGSARILMWSTSSALPNGRPIVVRTRTSSI
jgi:hypothetical protein